MRKAFHEVMIPARPPAMTSLPQNAELNMAASASAVTRSCAASSDAGMASDVIQMMMT